MVPNTAGVDFQALEEYSVANCTEALLTMFQSKAKKPSVQEVSQRVDQSMARPGPSVRAEDLSQAPFAGNIDLIAPTKYRYASHVDRKLARQTLG